MLDKVQQKQLKQVISLCKKENVKSIKFDGIEIEFNSYAPKTRRKKANLEDPKVENEFSEEDVLFWSSGAPV